MKGKRFFRLALVMISAGLLFSCSNKTVVDTNNTAKLNQDIQIQADDQVRISDALDAAFNDVDVVLTEQDSVTGGRFAPPLRRGVTVTGGSIDTTATSICNSGLIVNTVDTPNTIYIGYGGPSCDLTRNRQGSIVLDFYPGTKWSTPLDTIAVYFQNFQINSPSDTNSITLNGLCYYVNVSGGTLSSLKTSGTPIIHDIIGVNLYLLYNTIIPSYWQIGRQRTYTYSNSNMTISTTGIDTAGGVSNVTEWGGSRFGNSVIESTITPLVISQSCNYRIMSGQTLLTNPIGATNVTFGLNSAGSPATACPLVDSAYYFKVSWSGQGNNPFTGIFPYY